MPVVLFRGVRPGNSELFFVKYIVRLVDLELINTILNNATAVFIMECPGTGFRKSRPFVLICNDAILCMEKTMRRYHHFFLRIRLGYR